MTADEERPEIPVVCTACETRTQVPFDDVEAAVSRHNEQLHDGEAVAEVDPDVLDALTDRIGQDMGLFDGDPNT
ncbi:hypothetical protein NDI56_04450 [Haloarcula sp. S1CR25-12]|uniref:DUF8149 domain-containing protein n=1 Tax=Haloarcula saliterrae TaxID=2950534 RepID=A0ABU2F8R4_9EURY|nr:hypothetical protein [Haloarcula sp. S1CR25-12]MDS0258662.1 hypothetical protein [Haloarcula sp. S1CR25-12]